MFYIQNQVLEMYPIRTGMDRNGQKYCTFITHFFYLSSDSLRLRLVQKQLDHTNINTTTMYSDIISKDLDEAVEKLE